MGGKERELGWNGAGKGYFMADKKPASRLLEQGKKVRFRPDKKSRKCLSVLQAVYLHSPRLSAPAAFICTALVYLRQPYPRRKPFPHQPRLSAP